MANNFKPWVDAPTAGQQVQSASVFADDAQRVDGFKAGDPASALRVNSALRQANVVIAGLMQFCDDVKTLPSGLSLLSTVTQVKNAIKDSIDTLHDITLTSAKNYTDTNVGDLEADLQELQNEVDGKQDALTFDDTPSSESDNPVKSRGIYAALDLKANSADLKPVAFSGNYNDLLNKPNPVLLAGNQTIDGIKTFSSSPVVPVPTNDNHAANFGLLRLSAQGANVRGSTDSPTNEPGVVRGQFSLSNWTDLNKPFIVVTCFAMGSGTITGWATKSFTPMILVRCGSYYEGSGAISFYYSSSSDPIPITARISITASNGGVNVYVQRPLQIPPTAEEAYEPITFIGMTGLYI